jgi:hypothetical protein
MMREYINVVEVNGKNSGGISDDLKEWIQWAKKKVDWYDPLINLQDAYLEDVDKTILTFNQK